MEDQQNGQPQYKYGLKEKFNGLPHNERTQKIKEFCENCGIVERTLYKYQNIALGDDQDVPGKVLAYVAKFFDCPIEDLINYEVGLVAANA